MSRTSKCLPTISLTRLNAGEEDEIQRLLLSCKTAGAFLLDLSAHESDGADGSIFTQAEKVSHLAQDFFELGLEHKLAYEMDKWGDMQIGGYKATGKHTGVVSGKRDGFENFLVPLNRLLGFQDGVVPGPLPPNFVPQTAVLQDFEEACHGICNSIFSVLSSALDVTGTERFENAHRLDRPSTTSLAMLKYLPTRALAPDQVGHMAHTDVGSLTLLFTASPGLEVYSYHTSTWVPLTPAPGTVVVNVGDSLRFLSKGVLRSCLHRVVPQVSQDTGLSPTRFALAFFARPELDAGFTDDAGNAWTGAQWHRRKYRIFRASNCEQLKNSLLTGKTGFIGDLQDYKASLGIGQ
ncbi:Clavaminate synthase-like protein [Xylariomycetidae sp. FL0641]|nr:Clavaminate synthase-like protein [Xylariomycetidae sp. FL0641]